MTAPLDFITERDAELSKYSAGWGCARIIGKAGEVGLGTAKARIDSAGIDRGAMSVPCIVSTEDEDNSLDIIITEGIDLTIHQANPVVKFDHGQALATPIGKAQSPDGTYSVVRGPGLLKSVTYFSQSNLEAEQLFQLCEEAILNGVSIGALPILDKIEKRNVLNWKGLAGMLVKACRMFEYSHTPSPDNPRALTDRVLGGRLLAGKSLSPALYKSFEPYLITPPVQVTVPALAAEVVKQLKAEGIVKSEPAPVKKDTPYQPVSQEDDLTPTPNADKQKPPPPDEGDDPMKDYPPGAKAMAGLHDRVTEMLAFIGGSIKGQEHPAVKELLADMTDELTEKADGLRSFFKEHYSDVGELKEPDKEAEEGSDEGNRTQKAMAKAERYVLPYRKSIIAGIAADNSAAAVSRLTAENDQLRQALKDSVAREQQIRSKFNKAKRGQ